MTDYNYYTGLDDLLTLQLLYEFVQDTARPLPVLDQLHLHVDRVLGQLTLRLAVPSPTGADSDDTSDGQRPNGANGSRRQRRGPSPVVELQDADLTDDDLQDDEYMTSWQRFTESYQRIKQQDASPSGPAGDFYPLKAQLYNLLLWKDSSNEPAHRISYEKLLIAPGRTDLQAAEMFDKLRANATHVHVSVGNRNGTILHFFHIKDDLQRWSRASSLLRTDALFTERTMLLDLFRSDLDAYGRQAVRFALPEEHTPNRYILSYFCRLMLEVPQFFDIQRSGHRADIMGAVFTTNNRPVFLPLRDLPFKSQSQMIHASAWVSYSVAPLTESKDGLSNLYKQVKRAAPDSGYRLALLPARHGDLNSYQKRLNEIRKQLHSLSSEHAELESYGRHDFTLLRFSPHQLAVFANQLRRIPPSQLSYLLYGFQATQRHPEGEHFLLYDASNIPLIKMIKGFDVDEKQHMEFWPDPTWARYYADRRYHVFVPRGLRLSPPMHSWDAAGMKQYLHDMLTVELETTTTPNGQRGGNGANADTPAIPDYPIYIFDTHPSKPDKLFITILDYARMTPLDKPSAVGWWNKNLIVLREHQDTNAFIEAVADRARTRQQTQAIVGETKTMQSRFDNHSTQAAQAIMATTQELVNLLDSEIKHFLQRTATFAQKSRELNRRLDALERLYEQIEPAARGTTEQIETTKETAAQIDREMAAMLREVTERIASAQKESDRIEADVSTAVDELTAKRQSLMDKLARLDEDIRALGGNVSDDDT